MCFNYKLFKVEYEQSNVQYLKIVTNIYFDKNEFWNRKIDYLLTNKSFVENSEMTHQNIEKGGLEMMSRSDHAMTSVKFYLLEK